MTSPATRRRELDAAWVLLIGLTLAMFLLDRAPERAAWLLGALLGMAVLKSVVIGASFMGLLRASRPALAVLATSFAALACALAALLSRAG